MDGGYPRTLDEAVEFLMRDFAQSGWPSTDFHHLGLAMWVRQNFGLWRDNYALINDLRSMTDSWFTHPDNAAVPILDALRERIRSEGARKTGAQECRFAACTREASATFAACSLPYCEEHLEAVNAGSGGGAGQGRLCTLCYPW